MNFIVIDDNMVDCFIAEKVIQNSGLSKSCHTFQEAPQALEHIKKKEDQPVLTVVFVDEQMPLMNGMDFVKAFDALTIANKDHYHIYILSSSISDRDMAKIKSHAFVKKFINKPLMIGTMHSLFEHDLKYVRI